ncbi:PREDICTED: structural maintenance of chromosomes protein 2-like [Amphimedon queenslandica]|uniref:Structural maintenance of chromosomes protein n=1 Tax=Amphimedon queenslandica TaxID=400682 RepID=A0A1X7V716_AMPQE|nr:PREDICTED: structural maintenance of chromosomes protein 2-like [Amphimedon queenslandica]|eukprot:XP_019850315.1 PREDICTED: structural maintenance of chromosomes protein 2-like [Amphimedon queenslandica]
MFIKSIVIDGFKSYAHRTEVGPFDPQFNAITGLNGSGKSNILDSICFLLGISNLSQVRAGSLQELVYKGGQAGVTKATVTITFDNSDKKQSPVGYDSFDEITVSRQVVIGGRNKYLINGSNAPPTRVQDLFRSVQLNVNNPHFLIMQGRITKVLNMKPVEILSMIEEAAGTRMYESKKISAQNTIVKKDTKLSEIDKIIGEEITPTLKKLKEERSSYLEYQKVSRELEHLCHVVIAYSFVKAEERRKVLVVELETAKSAVAHCNEMSIEINESIVEVKSAIKDIRKQREDEEHDGPLGDLEKKSDLTTKALALAESTLKHTQTQIASEQKSYAELQKSLKDDEDLISKRRTEAAECQKLCDSLKQKLIDAQQTLANSQKHFQAVSSGLSGSSDGQAESLSAQKIAKENEVASVQTTVKQSEMRLQNLKTQLKDQEKAFKSGSKSYASDKAAYESVKKEIAKLEASISRLNYSEGQYEDMTQQREILKQEISEIKRKIGVLGSKFPHLQFEYSNPSSTFDRSTVKGPIAKLLKMKDETAATALEVTAGGKLFHIVVSSEEIGKQLLQHGRLKRRFTIIPLNKIVARKIANDVVKRAQQLVGPEKAKPALSLIDYDAELQAAMEFVFGTTFICETLDDAQQVTFNKKILTRSVALAGDVFDPSGTLTGGSRPHVSSLLVKLQELAECEEQLEMKSSELDKLNSRISEVEITSKKYVELKDELDKQSHEAEVLWAQLEQSSHHQQLMQCEQLKESIKSQESVLAVALESEISLKTQLKELEHKIKNSKSLQKKEIEEAENKLSGAKEEADKAAQEASKSEQELEGLQLEISELESSVNNQKAQIEKMSKVLNDMKSLLSENEASLQAAMTEMEEAAKELAQFKEILNERNKELQQQEKKLKDLEAKKSELAIKLKENEHKVSSCVRDGKDAEREVETLLEKHDWIASDRQFFGEPNTGYDFKKTDPKEAEKKIAKLQQQKEKLSKNVNMRAMNMLGKAEEKYNDLMKKKKIVENDKAKIAELIQELDQKKNEALQTAWSRVNRDFGSIFSTLLPGSSAKLSPPQGLTVLDGLEVKVAFGDVWKESLTELSGGQRSLVALSLILSLLLFKPAPLYILDEVDAALDLSHTQNIGQMLRTHFHHSQFIVVSLKNGMFNNANVLFKTKFVDGVSTVTRYSTPNAH